MRFRAIRVAAILLLTAAAPGAEVALLTADGEGHTRPCESCPTEVGLGGLARRVTLIRQRRAAEADLVLVEAGNFLCGSETVADQGRRLVRGYAALRYDAVNVSYRDLGFGKSAAVASLAPLPAISANLVDASTGEPLFKPYVVVKKAGVRIGIIGLSEAPPDVAELPRVQAQLKGVRIDPPLAALDRVLPGVLAQVDRVVVAYYGSASGVEALREHLNGRPITVLVGGCRVEAAAGLPRVIGVASQHGKYVAQVSLAPSEPDAHQWPVAPAIPEDSAISAALTEAPAKE